MAKNCPRLKNSLLAQARIAARLAAVALEAHCLLAGGESAEQTMQELFRLCDDIQGERGLIAHTYMHEL